MNRFVFIVSLSAAALTVVGCNVVPPLAPIESQPHETHPMKDGVIKVSLSDAIARYAPPSFQFDPNADVDYSMPVHFDTAMPWRTAFDKALAEAHVDRDALRTPARLKQTEELADDQVAAAVVGPATVPKTSIEVVTLHAEARVSDGASQSSSPSVTPPSVQPATVKPITSVPAAAPVVATAPVVPQCRPGVIPDGQKVQVWEAKSNSSLKQTLAAWNVQAGWELSWTYKDEQTNELSDLTLGGGKSCIGTYREAVKALLDSLPDSEHVGADLVLGNTPPLLRVYNEGKEDQ